ncbi:hypothetical protein COY13_01585 [Candidatus Roizmanbacteria bacterium CG_4_10_14_0_2_um_filter_36_35]|uniref:Transposase IS200-like domain-containing protein n=4 Tax=Candidatus Roizmaniibacteriota TaxID=1752723 RepID=A0A2M7BX96_9BACT|nr:MAG: hypothetical protein COV86_04055 [Candidatus Roizmanbacteria bacterium CG11_big_fil_rev_8_21_14_0_20_35_14]PIV11193.1 MAG: hypothetical protein COS50_01460 [Candidatus Roizmanbacteria bacterium CG03_land_8_20_14_0_80_35_26]PIZ68245.1 MAG: hypothetical protein COY13_01585 [Candidatus Roizmanbacteria bacterium CG_4_10_14_0_2_um_filter_36_35]PJC30729.1 MAG: hypothetical protein CO049_04865 [Candidatus Roizmanbacteria bacterium CG_4_9_14_0_2_um_filter_36_12]PJC80294.1 MAG: hypothetical prot
MTLKRPPLSTNEFYHVYNKSIADENIFDNLRYLGKILEIVDYYQYNQRIKLSRFYSLPKLLQENYLKYVKKSSPLINIYSFSFMPNHFHFLLKQLEDNGVKKFLSNIQNSYAKCFNLINNRNGSLFLNSFKYKRIINEETFIHVCRYVHLNPVTSHLIEFNQLVNYPFCSYSWYLNNNLNRFVNTDLIMSNFKTKDRFIKFHKNQVDYQRRLKEIKDLLME